MMLNPPADPFGTGMGTTGLFSPYIPYLDDGVIPLGGQYYIKVVDLLFMVGGGLMLYLGYTKDSAAFMAAGAILILAGILGVAIGWD